MAAKKGAKKARAAAHPRRATGKPMRARRAKNARKAARTAAKPARKATRTAAKPARKATRTAAKPARKPTARPSRAPAAPESAIGCRHMHMDYTTHSIEDVRRFYTETLGFREFQYDPDFGHLSVRTGPASSLGFMPPMPGPPEQWRPPREPVIYLHVGDVDQVHRDLLAKGVTFRQEPTDMPWGHRVAILRDPEGRAVFLAQPIPR